MIDVSILIPARNEKYLQKTIHDLLSHTQSKVEIIVGLDDYWPDPPLEDHPDVKIYHSGKRIGMRPMINRLASIAKGKYLMKTDAHCSFDVGYDVKLISICKPNYTVLGIRYELNVKDWIRKDRTNCDFRYLSNPAVDELGGLRGLPWHDYKGRTKGEEVSETMSISGSGWLMERSQFEKWGGLDENHGTFGQEGCEISCKTWLSGGKVLVNRRTWYAHWNRGRAPYALSLSERDKSVRYSIDYWMNNKWPLQKYSFQWLLEKFAPVPGWETPQEKKMLKAPRQGTIYKGYNKPISVKELWENREVLYEPKKSGRITIMFEALEEVIDNLIAGKTYNKEDMEKSRYFEYLRTHLAKKERDPLTNSGRRHIINKFKNTIALFESIKNEGLRAPLEVYNSDGNLLLVRGYRRLLIIHKLGYETVPILIHKDEKIAKTFASKFGKSEEGSLVNLGAKQFTKYLDKSTDKYWVHNYLDLYDKNLSFMRKKKINILEFGLLRGASLALWHEAFPKAKIYGVDKNKSSWREFTEGLDRIKVFVGMQEDVDFLKKKVIPKAPFHIIIDDCGHNPKQQQITFETMWPHVSIGGFYIIEDTYRNYAEGNVNLVAKLATWVDKIYLGHSVKSIQFYYNICIIQKGM